MSHPLHAHGKSLPGLATHAANTGALLGRITRGSLPASQRPDAVRLLANPDDEPATDLFGYAAVLTSATPRAETLATWIAHCLRGVHSLSCQDHLSEGDVVSLQPNGYVRTLYRRASPHNAIFATDRCNSLCLMCSQPPKPADDTGRLAENLRLVDLIDPETRELGITGGEPTLLKDGLLTLVARCKQRLPATALHILSNGRLFYFGSFARALAEVRHPDLMVGTPLYSDLDYEHDHVVQARNAFHQTVVGLQNLGRYEVAVEIRVVVHRLTWERLLPLAEFIYRNFTFASHVTFMGLELMGFAVPNLERLWIDPADYQDQLWAATRWLHQRGMHVSIYNHPLCLLPRPAWPFARRSISDWKNEYLPACQQCAVRDHCCGFFSSVVRRRTSRRIAPIRQPWAGGGASPSAAGAASSPAPSAAAPPSPPRGST